MPSPFPGMDPWLEAPGIFPGFHTRYLTALSAALNAVLPPPFFAEVSTRVVLEESGRQVEPDVDILTTADRIADAPGATRLTPGVGLLEVLALAPPHDDDELTEAFVEVRTADGQSRLVTSLELLSPTNKNRANGGRRLFLQKQHELRRSGVHLVELDLLRAGTHATAVNRAELRRLAPGFAYHASIAPADRWDATFAAPLGLADPLPTLPIPLTADTPAVSLNLQAAFDRCYDEAAYARRIDYAQPPQPPLTTEQAAWASAILGAGAP